MKKSLFAFLFLIFTLTLSAQSSGVVEKETVLYSVKGEDNLYLDKYALSIVDEPKACIIFLFGGGFFSGERDAESYQQYFNNLAQSGYTVVSIDYRLGFKGASLAGFSDPMQFVQKFQSTIDMAVEDLFDATNYILTREDWHIDPSTIIASGSSAGAITVLHGEYNIANSTTPASVLPEGFNYAGVMSFAGAILSLQGDLVWANNPCPMLFFHGDADSNVPYDKAEYSPLGFYGSKHIAGQMKEKNIPYFFYDVKNAAHEISGTPMTENLNEIETFITKLVLEKQLLMIEAEVDQIGKPEANKEFTIIDYVKSNFGM